MRPIFRSTLSDLSRREFLQLSGTSLLALLLLPITKNGTILPTGKALFENDLPANLGRVCSSGVGLYEYPSFSSHYLETLRRDVILPISNIVTGDGDPPHNRIWYELDGRGFAHSGTIQPVQNNLNEPSSFLPDRGALVEVTVPFTEAHWSADASSGVPYKLYFGSTYWADKVKEGAGGTLWYRIRDEEDFTFYVQAAHVHILSEEELSPISRELPLNEKRMEVHIQDQLVIAYEQEQPVFMSRVATGATFQTGNFQTPVGQFMTNRKRPTRHMIDPYGSSYDLPGVPWVSYLTERGVAFHGTYWHNDFGKPRSHGCINLSNEAARWIYRWTLPVVPLPDIYLAEMNGTRVDVF
jgi:hypothetical protein